MKSPELPWTAEQAVLIDHVGNEVYASHYAERKMGRFIIVTLAVLLTCSVLGNISLAKRKLVYSYVRIDDMGRATAIAYNDLNYSAARRRDPDVSDRLGQLPVHDQPRDHREEVPAQLLLPFAAVFEPVDGG